MVGIQTISIAIASAGVLVAVAYYVLQIRHQTKLRETDLIMRLHSYACSKEGMEAFQKMLSTEFDEYDDFVKKYGPRTAAGPETTPVLMIGRARWVGAHLISLQNSYVDGNTLLLNYIGMIAADLQTNNTVSENEITGVKTVMPGTYQLYPICISVVNSVDLVIKNNQMTNATFGLYCINISKVAISGNNASLNDHGMARGNCHE